jgi:NAD+ synthase (glutamine-hydrolysing)
MNKNRQEVSEDYQMAFVRIAQAQINTTVGDFSGNLKKIIGFIDMARDKGSDIVTFPELTVCGYPPEDLLLKSDFLDDNLQAVDYLKQHVQGIVVVAGYVDSHKGNIHSAAAVLQHQKLMGTYHKIELPNYGVFDEKRYFKEGTSLLLFELNQVVFAMTICEDVWIEGGTVDQLFQDSDLHIVLNISASPFHAEKLKARQKTVHRFAQKSDAIVCFNNLVGGQDELVFDGGSFIMGPDGRLLARAKRFQEELLITDIEIDIDKKPISKPESGTSHKVFVSLDSQPTHEKMKFPGIVAEEYGRLDEIYQALTLGTRDYVTKNGFHKAVIGLSGGIDSALTAAIAVGALGSDQVVGVTMPSQFTSSQTLSDAEILAGNLRIQLIKIPLQDIYESYLEAMASVFQDKKQGVTHENLQARIRGNILMALSNQFGWLVLTTGNKSETAVGYCTLYGDMAGGFAVIKDIPKTLVFELSEHINASWGREIIPDTTIKRPPSAELRPDQKDEDSLPPYSKLDAILESYVEEDRAPDEIIKEGFDPETVRDVVRMVNLNEYKRRQAPPGVKITPKAFGKDRRLPITNRFLSHGITD